MDPGDSKSRTDNFPLWLSRNDLVMLIDSLQVLGALSSPRGMALSSGISDLLTRGPTDRRSPSVAFVSSQSYIFVVYCSKFRQLTASDSAQTLISGTPPPEDMTCPSDCPSSCFGQELNLCKSSHLSSEQPTVHPELQQAQTSEVQNKYPEAALLGAEDKRAAVRGSRGGNNREESKARGPVPGPTDIRKTCDSF